MMRVKKIISVIICLAGLTLTVFAAFEDIGVSARAWGMGNTFVGIGDSAASIYYNPAALVRLNRTELLTSYARFYYGLSDDSNLNQSYLAFAYPLANQRGTIALEWLNFALQGYYTETTLACSYASRLTSRMAFGLNLKSLLLKYSQNAYTASDPTFANSYSAPAISADVAFLYEPAVSYRFGLVFADVLNPNIGLKSEEKVPPAVKFGFGYSLRNCNLGVDMVSRDNIVGFSSGLEHWLWRNPDVVARLGIDVGSGWQNIAFGLGYAYSQILRLDYGISLPLSGIKGTSGSHRLTIGLRFGPQVPIDLPYSKSELEVIITEARSRLARIKGETPEEETIRVPEKVEVSPKLGSLNVEQINSYYSQGLAYYDAGNYEKAITQWNEILKIDPNNQQALISINKAAGIIQQRQKDKRNREEANRLVVSGDFDYSGGDYQAALSKWEKALFLNPNQSGLAARIKKLREEINNKSEELYTKGLGLYYNNKIKDAIVAWKEALRINPYHEKAAKALNKASKEIGE